MAQLGRYHGTGRLAHIEDLAEAEAVPPNYLVQILNELRNGGMVTSRRGKQGGYALPADPAAITLYDVMRVVDPGLFGQEPSLAGQSGPQVARMLGQLGAKMESEAKSLTVRDLMPTESGPMYYI